MNVFDCRQQEKKMTQISETHLHFTAGIHGQVGIAFGQVLWKVKLRFLRFLKRMSQPSDAVKLVIPIAR